jgi:hypothetical protein
MKKVFSVILKVYCAVCVLRVIIFFIPMIVTFILGLPFLILLAIFTLPMAQQYDELVNNTKTNNKLDEIADILKKQKDREDDDDFFDSL